MALNEERVELRRAFYLARAFHLASTNDEVPREWADAVAEDESGVDELLFQWNKARSLARMAAKDARNHSW